MMKKAKVSDKHFFKIIDLKTRHHYFALVFLLSEPTDLADLSVVLKDANDL